MPRPLPNARDQQPHPLLPSVSGSICHWALLRIHGQTKAVMGFLLFAQKTCELKMNNRSSSRWKTTTNKQRKHTQKVLTSNAAQISETFPRTMKKDFGKSIVCEAGSVSFKCTSALVATADFLSDGRIHRIIPASGRWKALGTRLGSASMTAGKLQPNSALDCCCFVVAFRCCWFLLMLFFVVFPVFLVIFRRLCYCLCYFHSCLSFNLFVVVVIFVLFFVVALVFQLFFFVVVLSVIVICRRFCYFCVGFSLL